MARSIWIFAALTIALLAAASPALAQRDLFDLFFGARDGYPLDQVERRVPTEGALACPDVELETYRGELVRYETPVRITPSFRPKLRALEEVAAEIGTRYYGRAPQRILHFGTYSCRRVRGREYRMSEHALGNGIDVEGFSFGPLPRTSESELPRHLRRRFTVTVERDWNPRSERGRIHAEFLRALTAELARREVFRGMLGPRHRFHRNHFHFDYGPWRYRIL
jgi:hypothetical protein